MTAPPTDVSVAFLPIPQSETPQVTRQLRLLLCMEYSRLGGEPRFCSHWLHNCLGLQKAFPLHR